LAQLEITPHRGTQFVYSKSAQTNKITPPARKCSSGPVTNAAQGMLRHLENVPDEKNYLLTLKPFKQIHLTSTTHCGFKNSYQLTGNRANFPQLTDTPPGDSILQYMINKAGAFPRDPMDRRFIASLQNRSIDPIH
ncbi:MAG: hypothetical protein D6719_09570, partial [Candidatus Dadabacteria bacterium]